MDLNLYAKIYPSAILIMNESEDIGEGKEGEGGEGLLCMKWDSMCSYLVPVEHFQINWITT